MSRPVFSPGGLLRGQEGGPAPDRKRPCDSLSNLERDGYKPLHAPGNEGQRGARTRPPIDGFSPQKFSNTLVSADHAPGRLHVPVHPVLRGADNGAVEVCVAAETPPHLLTPARWGGLLQG